MWVRIPLEAPKLCPYGETGRRARFIRAFAKASAPSIELSKESVIEVLVPKGVGVRIPLRAPNKVSSSGLLT